MHVLSLIELSYYITKWLFYLNGFVFFVYLVNWLQEHKLHNVMNTIQL